MRLKGKNIVICVGPGYEELEFWVVYMRMKEEGANVKIVGESTSEEYASKHGCLTTKAEYLAKDIKADDIDALLIPGGVAPDKIRRDKELLKLVKSIYDSEKIIGMICHAGWVGISAGIVKGHKATGSTGIKDDLINAGAEWVDSPAFQDGNIVWGRVVNDIPDYCRTLVNAIE